MEKCYIVTNKEFLDAIAKYKKDYKERNEFFVDFQNRYGIDGNEYYIRGDGGINCPFPKSYQKDINLSILDTENNLSKFASDFKKTKRFEGLSDFKKSSKLLKQFQEECVDKQIVINLWDVRVGDYFKELRYGGYSAARFEYDDKFYLRVSTDNYKTITPLYDGFEEIKQSDFHIALEAAEESERENEV